MSEYRHIANLTGPQGDQGDQGVPGIGSHGVLSSPTNLDNLRSEGDIGIYGARTENLINGPDTETGQVVTLEVLYSATNGITQKVSTPLESWWRTASSSTAWNPWRRTARFDEVTPATHGVIEEPTDLDELRSQADIGHYTARADNLTGAPELEGDNPLVALEVLWGISNGVTQRITSRDEMWWRSASSSSAWDQWRRIGTDPIVATDRYMEVPEGRSLYVIDQRHRAYDFYSFPTDMNRVPDGAGGVWNTNTDDSLLDGRGIRQGGGAHSTIAWASTAGFTNGDILTRMQRNRFGTTANSALMVRLSEAGGSTSGYNVYVATLAGESRLAIGSRDAGSQAVLQSQAVNIAEGDVFYIRFNLDGDLLRARAWLDGEPEPETWLLSVQDDTHTTGLVGFQSSTISTAWDVLSINESGGPAA